VSFLTTEEMHIIWASNANTH